MQFLLCLFGFFSEFYCDFVCLFVLGFKNSLYFIFSKNLDHSSFAFYNACKLQQHLPYFPLVSRGLLEVCFSVHLDLGGGPKGA